MLQNLHTHSRFCDGADELEDIVLEAINQGFDTIGFSSHSFTPFDESYCMTDAAGYFDKIEELRADYRGRITILCGLEQDYFSASPSFDLDYVIGSVLTLSASASTFRLMNPQIYSLTRQIAISRGTSTPYARSTTSLLARSPTKRAATSSGILISFPSSVRPLPILSTSTTSA